MPQISGAYSFVSYTCRRRVAANSVRVCLLALVTVRCGRRPRIDVPTVGHLVLEAGIMFWRSGIRLVRGTCSCRSGICFVRRYFCSAVTSTYKCHRSVARPSVSAVSATYLCRCTCLLCVYVSQICEHSRPDAGSVTDL